MIHTICICGAGTMGSGIAQVAAQNGFYTVLFDVNDAMLQKAQQNMQKNLQLLADKKKISAEEQRQTLSRIQYVNDINFCIGEIIIEAVAEKKEVKIALFNQLAEVNHSETIFATNTSSLSVSKIAAGVMHPERVCGMHFFNPAPLMKLVEVVKAEQTRDDILQSVYNLALQMGKTPVICKDAPGFIVNRVARHYYLESLKLAEEGIATYEQADAILEASGFKMGPFKLMDLIGNDVNLAVTQSLYEACGRPLRFRPSHIQQQKVNAGELGKKTGRGYYNYQ
ncbi:MAG: 3-hydroxyacyl-CoA dehydrogenase NAD-binding domain-containing protein [Chitinophagaceae bacterium]|nr:3-hydroxyacyl-CoA dehydrogenase NAD-binding domain-containing protein [Chitinophagaceae bacterium]